jgi:HEAT repeat protein
MVAAQSLGLIAERPEAVLPALRRGLEDTSPMVVCECVNALGKFGSAARAAVPALMAAASAHPELKGNVRMALAQIDPAAAANIK